jgi:hypothetical protein
VKQHHYRHCNLCDIPMRRLRTQTVAGTTVWVCQHPRSDDCSLGYEEVLEWENHQCTDAADMAETIREVICDDS